MNANRVIVTGGSGFVGRHLSSALDRAGFDVLVFDVRPPPDSSLHFHKGDFLDTEELNRTFQSFAPDAVFHIGGVADARRALADPVTAARQNIVGTTGVLNAARLASSQRVLIASSCWVYNATSASEVDEDFAFAPDGGGHVYTTTMITRELLAHDFQKLYGLDFTILRYAPVYGPGMWSGLALGAFVEASRKGGPIRVFGSGEETRAFIYIDDLIDAHIRALSDVAANRVYNLEGPRQVKVQELAMLVSNRFGGIPIVHIEEPNRRGELRLGGRAVSAARARRELGWLPQIDIAEGLEHVLRAEPTV